MLRRLPSAALAMSILLGGCASVPPGSHVETYPEPPPSTPEPGSSSPYVPEPGRDAATIAEMRAAPPPAAPAVEIGRNASAEHKRLTTQGFVRIGAAQYAGSEDHARDESDRQARAVGADRVLVYAPDDASSHWNATFYVRFKLPFGATFRDLTATERSTLGGSGVEIGSVVAGTPASRANLLAGDFVIQVNGRPLADKSAFQNELRSNTGRQVTLTVVRNGETLQRVVRLGAVAGGNP